MSAVGLLLTATLGLGALFGAAFAVARRLNNYSVVDIVWSYAFGAVAIFYAAAGSGWWVRRALLAAVVTAWSLRLGTHLLVRIAHHHPTEDGRYQTLRHEWREHFALRMAGFFQLQALSVVYLSLPFLWLARHPAPSLRPWEWAGVALWALAIGGEALADAQLAAFKRREKAAPADGRAAAAAGSGATVCDAGLWRYSRHPNYFFEWLIWVAYALWACAAPWGWTAILSPASILYLLLRVTGIPMTEAQSIRSKGDAYRRYQARTSAFVPWPPRA